MVFFSFQIAKSCYVGSFQNGRMYTIPFSVDTVDVGTTIHFQCRTGYYLRCAGSAFCNPNGRLDGLGMMCSCDDIHCHKSSFNSTINLSPDKDYYIFHEPVHFSCDGDQLLHGSASARCTENDWEYNGPSEPVCGPATHSSQLIGK